jgi:fluoroquinolone resistance protein
MDTGQLRARLAKGPIEDAQLAEVAWTDLDCEGAKFNRCSFAGAQFTNTVFSGARFVGCRFLGARFSHAELGEAAFEECQFATRDTAATGCSFAFSNLRDARFTTCDLSLCQFDRSDLFAIEMDQCVLRGARFNKVDFSHAYSRKLVTTRAIFRTCNFELADLSEARLPGCELASCRFREADLSGADLTDAMLRDADLFQAILTGTKLAGADLRGAEISGLNLMELASFARMKIDQGQQHLLLDAIGIDVRPEPG